jgi:hypothetical protein
VKVAVGELRQTEIDLLYPRLTSLDLITFGDVVRQRKTSEFNALALNAGNKYKATGGNSTMRTLKCTKRYQCNKDHGIVADPLNVMFSSFHSECRSFRRMMEKFATQWLPQMCVIKSN